MNVMVLAARWLLRLECDDSSSLWISICLFCRQTARFVTDFEKESGDKSPHSKNQQAARPPSRKVFPDISKAHLTVITSRCHSERSEGSIGAKSPRFFAALRMTIIAVPRLKYALMDIEYALLNMQAVDELGFPGNVRVGQSGLPNDLGAGELSTRHVQGHYVHAAVRAVAQPDLNRRLGRQIGR